MKTCAAPYKGLHINFGGDVKTCCAGAPGIIGNINDKSISEILKSKELQRIRAKVSHGELDAEYCYNCIESEKYGSSERDWHNTINEDFDVVGQDPTQEHNPTLLDIRWNRTCNLSCNYCDGWASSKWAEIEGKKPNTELRHYYKDVVDYLTTKKSYIREVALVGGEPLLLKENVKLLDNLSDNTLITIITNLSVNFDTNKIVEKLKQRSRVGWSMSFDNVGSRAEYVRYGSSWKQLDSNARTVKKLFDQGHYGGIHAVYNLYNCTRLIELKQYATEVGHSILWQTLTAPEFFDPALHNAEVRRLAIEEIEKFEKLFGFSEQEKVFFPLVHKRLSNQIAVSGSMSEELRKRTDWLENIVHPKSKGQFEKLWPELAQAL